MNQNMIGANHSGLGAQLDKLSRSSKRGGKVRQGKESAFARQQLSLSHYY